MIEVLGQGLWYLVRMVIIEAISHTRVLVILYCHCWWAGTETNGTGDFTTEAMVKLNKIIEIMLSFNKYV